MSCETKTTTVRDQDRCKTAETETKRIPSKILNVIRSSSKAVGLETCLETYSPARRTNYIEDLGWNRLRIYPSEMMDVMEDREVWWLNFYAPATLSVKWAMKKGEHYRNWLDASPPLIRNCRAASPLSFFNFQYSRSSNPVALSYLMSTNRACERGFTGYIITGRTYKLTRTQFAVWRAGQSLQRPFLSSPSFRQKASRKLDEDLF